MVPQTAIFGPVFAMVFLTLLVWVYMYIRRNRWHHAVEIIDVNFSTKLAIWDWLFGTAYHPHQKPRGYGLAKGNFPSGYFRQVLYAFRIPGRSRPDTEASATGRAPSPL